MEDKILEAIREHLPEAQLSAIRDALNERSELKSECDRLNRVNYQQERKIAELTGEVHCLRALKIRSDELDKRELELEKTLLETKLEAEKQKVNAIQQLASTVFSNRSYTMVTSGYIPVKDRDGYSQSEHFTATTTAGRE